MNIVRVIRGRKRVVISALLAAAAGAEDAYIKQSAFPSCMANGLPPAHATM